MDKNSSLRSRFHKGDTNCATDNGEQDGEGRSTEATTRVSAKKSPPKSQQRPESCLMPLLLGVAFSLGFFLCVLFGPRPVPSRAPTSDDKPGDGHVSLTIANESIIAGARKRPKRKLSSAQAYIQETTRVCGGWRHTRPVAWVLADEDSEVERLLGGIISVLQRVGYRTETKRTFQGDFHFLYTHYSVFEENIASRERIEHQHMVNHLPGIGAVAVKAYLTSSYRDLPFMPISYVLPEDKAELMKHVASQPKMRWIQKSRHHRGVNLKNATELDFNKTSLVQEYFENLILVDGRRFDFGVFVVITSVSPLRVYIYDNWVVRFCPAAYEDRDNPSRASYVIEGDHTSYWDMPSFDKTAQYSTRRDGLLDHLADRGYDVEDINEQIASAIREVLSYKVWSIRRGAVKANVTTLNRYELLRFDFMIEDNTEVRLLEANLSPDLEITSHDPPFMRDPYEKMLYDMFGLVGVRTSWCYPISQWREEMMRMIATDVDLHVYRNRCMNKCPSENCNTTACRWCLDCLSREEIGLLQSGFVEHMARGRWRRVVPRPFKTREEALGWDPELDPDFADMHPLDQLTAAWFRGKCIRNADWCN